MDKKHIILIAILSALTFLLFGCPPSGIGEPCEPEVSPEGGFQRGEIALEVPSLQCQTRICLVWGNAGNDTPAKFCSKKCDSDEDCEGDIAAHCEAEANNQEIPEALQGTYCVPEIYSDNYNNNN